MSLHNRIAGLAGKRKFEFTYEQEGYLAACKDAAQIAKEADDLMADMAEAMLEYETMACRDEFGDILQKYWSWKESTK